MAHKGTTLSEAFQDTASEAQSCQSICVQSIQHCLQMGGSHVEPSHMRLMQDCAEICETTGTMLLRGSPQHNQVTAACASICELCAQSCDRFAGDAQMKACADACRHCAAACQQVAQMRPGGAAGPGHHSVP
ncbi:four-helix bundle copper-binding protein [Sorangium sp. So ce1078]|uniref:four-helix bundle copper-binding protein n=1 Tax=Sorangium sp. So ce1078 TaxID=3133329 RepID=UPI003F642C12